jgi:hypothetical protein
MHHEFKVLVGSLNQQGFEKQLIEPMATMPDVIGRRGSGSTGQVVEPFAR